PARSRGAAERHPRGGAGTRLPGSARDPALRGQPATRPRVRRRAAARTAARRGQRLRAPPGVRSGRRSALDLLARDRAPRPADQRRVRDRASAARPHPPGCGTDDGEHPRRAHEARSRGEHRAHARVRRDGEASRSLVAAVNRLAGNNLVLCCLLADPHLAEAASRSPRSTAELYERVIAEEVRDARARALALLRERGVHVIDVPAERLTVAAIQRYLELKKRWL